MEHGLQAPTENGVASLAGALGFPGSFFRMQGNLFPPIAPMHRKRAGLAKGFQEHAEALANLRRIHIQRLEQAVDIDDAIPRIELEEYDGNPARVAQVVRASFRLPLGPVENVVATLENHGAFIFLEDFLSRQLDAFTLVGDGLRPTIFVNRSFPGDRERLSLAHELGHIVMHSVLTANIEDEAWQFAEEFLLPATSIESELRRARRLSDFADLKRKWKVSMAALIRRAKNLAIIDANRYRYLMQQMAPYRAREPVPLSLEQPSLVKELISAYRRDLKYTDEDLLKVLCITKAMFKELYEQSDRKLRILTKEESKGR
jgi:Zn-dependent peptidase ImmA (M78 family)